MENNLKSIVYLTVNTVNRKMYVGVHVTETPYKFDNYWGCGITGTSSYHFIHPKTPFQRACKKYGLDAFTRYTLFVFNTYEEALDMERKIVNETFIKRDDTYNIAIGGGSGLVPSEEIEVHKYDASGKYICTYRSYSDAARKHDTSVSNIIHAVCTKGKAKDFYWSETRKANIDITGYKQDQAIPVYVYDFTGKYESTYDSMSCFCKKNDVNLSSVQKAISFHTRCCNKYLSIEKLDVFPIKKYTRKNNCTVYQYDKNGDYVREFSSSKEAREVMANKLTKLAASIQQSYLYSGYYWSYEKYEHFPVKVNKVRKIGQYDLNGNLIKIWDTLRACKQEFSNVSYVLNGVRAQTKGYTFKYVE